MPFFWLCLRWLSRDWAPVALLGLAALGLILALGFSLFAFGRESQLGLDNSLAAIRGFSCLAALLIVPRSVLHLLAPGRTPFLAASPSPPKRLVCGVGLCCALYILAGTALLAGGFAIAPGRPEIAEPDRTACRIALGALEGLALVPLSITWTLLLGNQAVYIANALTFALAALKPTLPIPPWARDVVLAPLPSLGWFDLPPGTPPGVVPVGVAYALLLALGYSGAAVLLVTCRRSGG